MSRETSQWLNDAHNVLIGFSDTDGRAWHWDAVVNTETGHGDNHYPGAIPLTAVHDMMSRVNVTAQPVYVLTDNQPHQIPNRVAVVEDSTNQVFYIGSDGYEPHQYAEWMVQRVNQLVGGSMQIKSAMLLKNRAVAAVSLSIPEIQTVEGVQYRPYLYATTSHDGTIASLYGRHVQMIVCDNTREMALGEKGQKIKVKHTQNSPKVNLNNHMQALNLVEQTATDFAESVKQLVHTEVSDDTWYAFLDAYSPLPEGQGRGRTVAENRRGELEALYFTDPRVTPWAGTAFGVLQATNTYETWSSGTRDTSGTGDKQRSRFEKNMLASLNGTLARQEANASQLLHKVLASV
jgi:phage/plasmid-like protein (TIGR03299 family)